MTFPTPDPAYQPVPTGAIPATDTTHVTGTTHVTDTTPATETADSAPNRASVLIVPFLIGGAVTVLLGTYGNLHEPTGIAVSVAGFSGPLAVKVWLATVAVVLAVVQLFSALAMYGKLGFEAPMWTGRLHRWSGRLAFLLAVPVAIHCLYAVGFQPGTPRLLVHSLLGCFFFGAFTVKMLILPRKGVPGWALPVFGGLVFTGLVGLWLTSSLWFFTTFGVKF
jgi:hypothetical protein